MEDNFKVCLLKKYLYELKQGIEQQHCKFDSCVYLLKRNEEDILYLFLYVDDILMVNCSKKYIGKFKETLNGELKMKDCCEGKRIS